MKTQLTFLLILLFSAFAGAQIPGGNFETWGSKNFEHPQHASWTNYHDPEIFESYGLLEKSSDASNGNFAVKLKTMGDYFGYVAYGQFVGDGLVGGIPFSDNPTQVTVAYKCNMAVGDSAQVWVWLYSGGSQITTDFFKVGGIQTVYADVTFNLSSYTQEPDSIVVGLLPCDPEANRASGNVVYFDNIRFNGAKNLQLPDNSFESWTTISKEYTSEMHSVKALIEKSEEAYSGNYALKMSTQKVRWDEDNIDIDFDSQLDLWGKTEWVKVSENHYGMHIKGGIPVQERQDALVFYYKYIPSAGVTDTATATLRFHKSGVEVLDYNYLLLPTSTYTKFAIQYDLDNNWRGTSIDADSMVLVLESSKWRNNWAPADVNIEGSSLYIDYINYRSQMCRQVANVGVNGTVSPTDTLVLKGNNLTYTITPNNGYTINSALYNGIDVTGELVISGNSYTYTATNVTEYGKLVVDFKISTGIDDIRNSNDMITIYPNPTSGKLYLQGPDKDYIIEMISTSGMVMFQKKVAGDTYVDISNLANGPYFVKINNRVHSKIIKQ